MFKNEIILKSQQRFKSAWHCVYTEKVNKIALSSDDDKILQTFDSTRTYQYGTNAIKVYKSEMPSKYKWLILIIILIKIKQHNLKWPYIPDYPYRILIIGGSGSRKTNALLNLISNQLNIFDKIYYLIKYIYMQKINMKKVSIFN